MTHGENMRAIGPGCRERYDLIRPLGKGAMGEVWLARDRKFPDRLAAVKFLLEGTWDVLSIERFFEEGRATARLHHPHVLHVLDMGDREAHPFIAYDYVSGPSLDERIAAEGVLSVGEIRTLGRQLCQAMAYAHGLGILHRDLKTANLLLCPARGLLVADFGLALREDRTLALTRTGAILGTPVAMAPELCRGERADRASDLYAAGVILHEMLTGRPPFEGSVVEVLQAHLTRPVPDPRRRRAGCPRELAEIVMACLAKTPAGRPRDFEELDERLRAVPVGEAATGGAETVHELSKATISLDGGNRRPLPASPAAAPGHDEVAAPLTDSSARRTRRDLSRSAAPTAGTALLGRDPSTTEGTAVIGRGPSKAAGTAVIARGPAATDRRGNGADTGTGSARDGRARQVDPDADGSERRPRRLLTGLLALLVLGGIAGAARLLVPAPPPPDWLREGGLTVEVDAESFLLRPASPPSKAPSYELFDGAETRRLKTGSFSPGDPWRLSGLRPDEPYVLVLVDGDHRRRLPLRTATALLLEGVFACRRARVAFFRGRCNLGRELRLRLRRDDGETVERSLSSARFELTVLLPEGKDGAAWAWSLLWRERVLATGALPDGDPGVLLLGRCWTENTITGDRNMRWTLEGRGSFSYVESRPIHAPLWVGPFCLVAADGGSLQAFRLRETRTTTIPEGDGVDPPATLRRAFFYRPLDLPEPTRYQRRRLHGLSAWDEGKRIFFLHPVSRGQRRGLRAVLLDGEAREGRFASAGDAAELAEQERVLSKGLLDKVVGDPMAGVPGWAEPLPGTGEWRVDLPDSGRPRGPGLKRGRAVFVPFESEEGMALARFDLDGRRFDARWTWSLEAIARAPHFGAPRGPLVTPRTPPAWRWRMPPEGWPIENGWVTRVVHRPARGLDLETAVLVARFPDGGAVPSLSVAFTFSHVQDDAPLTVLPSSPPEILAASRNGIVRWRADGEAARFFPLPSRKGEGERYLSGNPFPLPGGGGLGVFEWARVPVAFELARFHLALRTLATEAPGGGQDGGTGEAGFSSWEEQLVPRHEVLGVTRMGDRVVAASNASIYVFDDATAERFLRMKSVGRIDGIALSPEGMLFVSDYRGRLRCWPLALLRP